MKKLMFYQVILYGVLLTGCRTILPPNADLNENYAKIGNVGLTKINRGSSLTRTFFDTDRLIRMSGEVHFWTYKDMFKPFSIVIGDTNVITVRCSRKAEFNINAQGYEEREYQYAVKRPYDYARITVYRGRIKVTNELDTKTIKAGQSLIVHKVMMLPAAADEIVNDQSWLHGQYVFNKITLEDLAEFVNGRDLYMEVKVPADHRLDTLRNIKYDTNRPNVLVSSFLKQDSTTSIVRDSLTWHLITNKG